jgi:putative DNA primase/helicase
MSMIEFDDGQVRAWLSYLFGETVGLINIVSTNNWAGRSFGNRFDAADYVLELETKHKPQGIYVRMGTLAADPGEKRRGGVDDALEFVCLWADMDLEGGNHKTTKPLPATEDEILAIIAEAELPEPSEWIHSGGGYYPIWSLRHPLNLSDPELRKVVIDLSADWQRIIELASIKLGYSYGSGVGDISRVLRIPGTINRKIADDPKVATWRVDLGSAVFYDFDRLVQARNASLGHLEKPKPVVTSGFSAPAASIPGNRPGDAFNAATTWPQLLEADGAQIFRERGSYVEWVRPGKDRRDGMSATTGYMGSDVLKVFTDSWPLLRQNETYDRFGYYAATQHNGNIREATKHLASLGYGEKREYNPIHNWIAPSMPYAPEPQAPVVEMGSPKPPAVKPTYTFTDSGFADQIHLRHGDDWRYIATRKQWLYWDGQLWAPDNKGNVTNLINNLVKEEHHRISEENEEDEARKLHRALQPMLSNSKQLGTTAIFARNPQIAVDPNELDQHRMKITCGNGVFDLDAMTFGDHDRSLLATRKIGTSYDADAKAPGWEAFLADVLPDPVMRDYVQRAIGYTLTGEADQRAIFMLHGPSGTGKSQFLAALEQVFGGFCAGADPGVFRLDNSTGSGPNPSLHKLQGARFVTASELPEGMRPDEALIKRLTGMDTIHSRALYQNEESWEPEFAIWMATNHLPRLSSDDNAIWRRVKPIAFEQEFGTKDGKPEVYGLGRKLAAAEGPGILNWILEGVRKYRQDGLAEPESLRQGVATYQHESDPVARFITEALRDETLVAETDGKIESKLLYTAFSSWCADEGIRYPLAASRFGRRMANLGYKPARTATSRMWQGLSPGKNTFIISGQRWRE